MIELLIMFCVIGFCAVVFIYILWYTLSKRKHSKYCREASDQFPEGSKIILTGDSLQPSNRAVNSRTLDTLDGGKVLAHLYCIDNDMKAEYPTALLIKGELPDDPTYIITKNTAILELYNGSDIGSKVYECLDDISFARTQYEEVSSLIKKNQTYIPLWAKKAYCVTPQYLGKYISYLQQEVIAQVMVLGVVKLLGYQESYGTTDCPPVYCLVWYNVDNGHYYFTKEVDKWLDISEPKKVQESYND